METSAAQLRLRGSAQRPEIWSMTACAGLAAHIYEREQVLLRPRNQLR